MGQRPLSRREQEERRKQEEDKAAASVSCPSIQYIYALHIFSGESYPFVAVYIDRLTRNMLTRLTKLLQMQRKFGSKQERTMPDHEVRIHEIYPK